MTTVQDTVTVSVGRLPAWVKPNISMSITAAVHTWMVDQDVCGNRTAQMDDKVSAFVSNAIRRTLTGDWGDLCDDDRNQNDEATQPDGGRIMAAYDIPDELTQGARDMWGGEQDKLWIIIEHPKDQLTVLFPGDY